MSPTSPLDPQLRRRALLSGGIVGLFFFLLYLWSLAPALPPGYDSAELIAACAAGGIAHPPGYPLYTLLGWGLCSLHLWDPAYTMNLFSALCGAGSCALVAATSVLGGLGIVASLAGASLYGLALTPWRMAVGAEVFAFHLFLVALFNLVAFLWYLEPAKRRGYGLALAFLLGLALSHHQTIILLLPGLGLLFYLERFKGLGLSWWQAGAFLGGLLPYLWLPLRARVLEGRPLGEGWAMNWGNPSDWEGFYWVISRSGYGTLQLSTQGGAEIDCLASLGGWLLSWGWSQFFIVGALLALVGLSSGLNKARPWTLYLLSLLILAGPIWSLWAAQPQAPGFGEMLERFYATSYLASAYFIAWGWQRLFNKLPKAKKSYSLALESLCLFSLGIGVLFYNYPAASERGAYLVNDTLRSMAAQIPDKALVLAQNDATCGGLIYAQAVEGRRFLLVPVGVAHSPWFIESLPPQEGAILAHEGLAGLANWAASQGRDVYFDVQRTALSCALASKDTPRYVLREGLLYRYLRPGEEELLAPGGQELYLQRESARLQRFQTDYHPIPWNKDPIRRPFWEKFYLSQWKQLFLDFQTDIPSRVDA